LVAFLAASDLASLADLALVAFELIRVRVITFSNKNNY
jgi:hypothetical protein